MDLKGRFLASCRARGMSRKTIELYRLALSQLEDFGALSELDEAMVAEYLDRELDRNSRSTANTKLQVVRSFARWAVAAGELPARLLDQLPARVKHPAPEPRVATVEQLHTLLPELPLHHKVAVLLMVHAGLRISEVTGLTGKDVDLAGGVIRVLGKGQRQRLAPIATEQLSVALGERLEQMARDTEYVVPGRGGSRMDESSVRKMLQRTCERLGVRRLNPHAFRHAFAAEAVRSGVHIKSVQRALGHSTLSTTDRYLQSLAGAEELTSAFAHFDEGGS